MGIKGRSLSLLVSAIIIAVPVSGWWLISRPLPDIGTPPIDEARDRSSTEESMWDEDLLRTLGEPRIDSLSPEADEVYRLILLPTFHMPIVVRVEKTGQRTLLTVKLLDGVGGYGLDKMGKIALEETRGLSHEEYERFCELLDDAEFWGLPVRDPGDLLVMDGATWIIDARHQATIHSIGRIFPESKVLELCRFFLQLAGREDYYAGYWS